MKHLTGKVVSVKMNNAVVVEIESIKLHKLYGKYLKKTKRYKVHCQDSKLKEGDTVKIISTRPISKEIHYKILS